MSITRASFPLFLATLSGCVASNLDNAFDPATPTGLYLGSSLSNGGTSASDSTPATLFSTQEYTSAGSFLYSIPADAARVDILIIGGGGGGGEFDVANDNDPGGGCSLCSLVGETGGTSSVSIQGGATIATATGGAGGNRSTGWTQPPFAPAIASTGGSGGTPNGVAGESGNQLGINHVPLGGAHSGYSAGAGGNGGEGGPVGGGFDWYAGAGGGSGGYLMLSFNDLAGKMLSITVGAGGRRAETADGKIAPAEQLASAGSDGYARIKVYK